MPAPSANNLYRALFELLTAPPGEAASEMLHSTGRATRRELLSIARQEGCLPELYALWNAQDLLSPSESIEHEHFARRGASAAEVRRALPRGSLLVEIPGLRSGSKPLVVLLPDFAAIGPLHEALVRIGLRLHGAGEWLVPLRDPTRRGVATIRYALSLRTDSEIAVEVQVAGVPIDERRNLAFSELAAHAIRPDGLACRTLEPTRLLLHGVATFGARTEAVTVREIAELHLLLKNPARRVDTMWLHGKIEQMDVWSGLRRLRDAIVDKRLGALLSWGEFGRLIETSVGRTNHVAARPARAPRAGAFLRTVFDTFQGPRDDGFGARLARAAWIVSRVSEAGYRVRGVPVSNKAFDAPRLLRIDGALYLATGAGLILLSLVDLCDRARTGLGERVRMGSRPVVLARWTAGRSARGSRAGTS
jgi:hypothetical protein